ncbi:hypothetical protein SteCoe_4260 [Stentor coeruleus]|uniref:RIIa domain-containing protein n=1 Tax=Stentor coeruleus TaxID=5963 RepID=A0A1R2CV81_9CILI|nr:hypothetical protein SteCoe_4260 [Stentor coeruleus]
MASKYLQLFPVPQTLPHIIRDLTREILRYQPQDIIQFCAAYFKAKQEHKDFIWEEANPRNPRPSDYKIPPKKSGSSNKTGATGRQEEKKTSEKDKKKINISTRSDGSSFSQSLPENTSDAAHVYVGNLMEKAQKSREAQG